MMTKMCNPDYLVKARQLSEEDAERLLSRMTGKLPRRLQHNKLNREEALAMQLELEDEQLEEWRRMMRSLRKKETEKQKKGAEKQKASASDRKSKTASAGKKSEQPEPGGKAGAVAKLEAVSGTGAKRKTASKAKSVKSTSAAEKDHVSE